MVMWARARTVLSRGGAVGALLFTAVITGASPLLAGNVRDKARKVLDSPDSRPAQRVRALESVRKEPTTKTARWLVDVLLSAPPRVGDPPRLFDPELRDAGTLALGDIAGRSENVRDWAMGLLRRRIRATRWQRLLVMDALVGAGDERYAAALRGLLSSRGAWYVLRARACDLLARLRDGPAYDLMLRVLAREGEPWPVRGAAAAGLRAYGREMFRRHGAPGLLIPLVGDQPDRVRGDVIGLLSRLTGETFGTDRRGWRRWWEQAGKQKTANATPLRAKKEGGAMFFGIRPRSARVAFVVDISASMRAPVSPRVVEKLAAWAPGRGLDAAGITQKLDLALFELQNAVEHLEPRVSFNVLFFGDSVEPLFPKALAPAGKRAITALQERVAFLDTRPRTNFHAALLAGLGARKRSAGWSPERLERELDAHRENGADTVVFLTDGWSTEGRYSSDDPALEKELTRGRLNRLCREIELRNHLRRVKIHTVGIGAHDGITLARLARASGGTYVDLGD